MLHGEAKTSPSQKEQINVDSFFPLLLSLNPDLRDSLGVCGCFVLFCFSILNPAFLTNGI